MSCILNIETSTDVCSVAVSNDGECIFNEEDHSGPNHAVKLGIFVDQALSFVDNHAIPLDAVAVSCGPGCYGRNVKLIAVPTLELLCVPVLLHEMTREESNALLCPMLDARRMEVYAQFFDRSLKEIRPIHADIVDDTSYKELLDKYPVYFFGNGADKCTGTIRHKNAHFIKDIEPLAKNMLPLAEKRMAQGVFEDVAYFVPFYLKDFVAKTPKKLL